MTIFRFNICYGTDDYDVYGMQHRYVASDTEEEAIKKIEAYNADMQDHGFMAFEWFGPWVELENVIT